MDGFILFLLAFLSCVIFGPFLVIYSLIRIKIKWRDIAISFDQLANVLGAAFWNDIFLKDKTIAPFGNVDKTISFHIGENAALNNLSKFGKFVNRKLNKIDPNHSKEAYENGT